MAVRERVKPAASKLHRPLDAAISCSRSRVTGEGFDSMRLMSPGRFVFRVRIRPAPIGLHTGRGTW